MLKIAQSAKMRGQHAADRSLVSRAVGMAPDRAKNRADVQTGSTSNAVQHLALFKISQQFRATVIEQDDMEFFGPVRFMSCARSSNQSVVTSDGLARSGGGQHRPKQRQVFKTGEESSRFQL